jgi:hypothetical protein
MRGLAAGSSSAAAVAPRQGLKAAFMRAPNSALQGFDKWRAAHKAQITPA